MVGTILSFRDDGQRPHCEIALSGGDRVQLILDAEGLAIARLVLPEMTHEPLFQGTPTEVATICAGLVGPKRQSAASPLSILAAAVQRIGSAAGVRSAFTEAAGRPT